jgi:hypothetical protein
MRKVLAVVLMFLFVVAVSLAGAADMVTLTAKTGDVTFNHKVHGEKYGCKSCHGEAAPAKMSLGGKDPAHKLCQGCHTEKKAGPTKCMECHKKK